MRRRTRKIGLALGVVGVVATVAWASRVPYDRAALAPDGAGSVRVTARDGTPLRVTLDATAEARATWLPLERIAPRLVEATLAAEDRRFRRHPGIDPAAALRATAANLRARRVVAGGSTLTQQLAGLVWPEPRTVRGKLREAVRAVRLEIDFSKDAILEQYLNRVPYAPGVQGAAQASARLLGRDAGALAASQAVTLAALPQAPSRLARDPAALRRRRDRILDAMRRSGALTSAAARDAQDRDLELQAVPAPFAAPHFADWVLATRGPALRRAATLETTLDAELQRDIESIVAQELERLRGHGVSDAAVVVEAVPSGEILALVGSPDWHDAADGQVNGALALRQPGSALKPFLYALGFASGLSPADVLEDLPFHASDGEHGDVAPRNYDGRFHGPVRARVALASSSNVPAVRVQEKLGTAPALAGLQRAGLESLDAAFDRYGLGLVLGVGEVTLLDLTNAYAGLARGGVWRPAVAVRAARDARGAAIELPPATARRWVDAAPAFLVADVLADDAARVPGFGAGSVLDLPFAVAVKTGTSTDYRNSWCVGFTRDHVVGVWAGNFDATPIHGLAGAHAAGPIFRALVQHLHARGSRPWDAAPPSDLRRVPVCALSGGRPGPACGATVLEWTPRDAERAACDFHRLVEGRPAVVWPAAYRAWAGDPSLPDDPPAIASPQDGSIYFRDPRLAAAQSAVRIAARAPHPDDAWTLDGRPLARGAEGALWPPQPGVHVLRLERAGRADAIRFAVR